MRLRAQLDSRVKVPDLANTEWPVTESNCAGAITPGGEQLEVNDQSVTTASQMGCECELDSVSGFGEPARERRSPNKIMPPAWSQWIATSGKPRMVGDRMVGSSNDVKQGTTVDGRKGIRRGQSVRSSEEASNECRAKGRRKVE